MSDEKCSPVDVKITPQPSIDREAVSQPMTKTLFTEGFRRPIRDPERYSRCFSVINFLVPSLDLKDVFRTILKLEDNVTFLESYKVDVATARKKWQEDCRIGNVKGNSSFYDDVHEHKEEIEDLSIDLNQKLYMIIFENWQSLAPLFEQETLEMIPKPVRSD